MPWLALWIAVFSVLAFALMGADKSRAVRRRYRIPERILFAVAVLGGSPGVLAGMLCFRHKTRHNSFRIGIPALIAMQAALIVALLP